MATSEHTVEFAGARLGRDRHICALFYSPEEEHRVLRSFVREGFDRGERAFHVVDPARRSSHLEWLEDSCVDLEAAVASGQLQLRSWEEAYLRGGQFDQDAMLALVEESLQSGVASGYPLTRLIAHMEWACSGAPGVDDLVEYETRLNYILPKYDDPVICIYDLSRFDSTVAMDILRTHPVVIIGGVLQENPFFIPPAEFLLEIRERRSTRKRERIEG